MSRDLGRDVSDLEKLYARKLWADFRTLFLPQIISFELIMRSNSASHYVDRPRSLGYKILQKSKSNGN